MSDEQKNVEKKLPIIKQDGTQRLPRKQKRQLEQLSAKLIGLLGAFYGAMGKQQLNKDELSQLLNEYNKKWNTIVINKGFGKNDVLRLLFVKEVRATWKKKLNKAKTQQ